MATKAVATLTNTHDRERAVTEEGTGRVLVKLVGAEGLFNCAAASPGGRSRLSSRSKLGTRRPAPVHLHHLRAGGQPSSAANMA